MFLKRINDKSQGIIVLILFFILLCVVVWPYLSFFVCFWWDNTTITFQNNSGSLIDINSRIVDVEQDGFEWKYESEIANGDKNTLEVDIGIKRIEYTINQVKGEIDFDMWSGDDVILVINSDKTIEKQYKHRH